MAQSCRGLAIAQYRALAKAPFRAMSTQVTDGPGKDVKNKDSGDIEEAREALVESANDAYSGQTKINHNHDGVGFKQGSVSKRVYLNPLLTPPPRSPKTPEDFSNPMRLGHWVSFGYDWTNPIRDRYLYHEYMFFFMFGAIGGAWLYYYAPDYRMREWARREAFLRTAKREALGLPLIDRNVVPPERVVLPTEEEIGDFPIKV